jgi:hypothetical protein
MNGGHRCGCGLRASQIAGCSALFVTLASVSGCVPIPIPGYSSGEVPTETINAIQPGNFTRTDVILMLADPDERMPSDTCFIYVWKENRGGVMFFTGAPMAFPVAAVRGDSCHKLVIQFAASGHVTRVRHFDSATNVTGMVLGVDKPAPDSCSDPGLSKQIHDWLAAPTDSPP